MMSTADRAASASQRGTELLDRVAYRIAKTDAEKDAIYRLRYRAYLHEGAIEPRAEGRLVDRFDELPNSWTIGVFMDGELASSLRISVATPDNPDTPAVDAFGDLLKPRLDEGKVIVDPNRFVADPDNRNRFPELPYLTVRLGYVACGYFNADIGTATARAEHRAFYRRVFLQESLCEPRPYPTLVKPLCLMAANYPLVRDRIFARYPIFRSTETEQRTLFARDSLNASPDLASPEFPLDPVAPLTAVNFGSGAS